MDENQIACKKCGKCCETMFLWLGKEKPQDSYIEFLELHIGVKVEQQCDAWGVRIPIKCSKLTEEGLCAIWDSPDRLQCCDDYKCWEPFWPKP